MTDTNLLKDTLDGIVEREKIHAGWMASVLMSLPHEPGFKKLSSHMREEIEAIIAAVE